ncbi:hypothetical protein DA075_25380 [Methylobacterium currus]|uniref:CpsD/CapB family tyrosine-protein kinase n=1 Tax=Methylobacterium currus TaxID=2051553 RepID=A0A2R4WQJ9_9HYPH|nr:hypothetical protein [Methylobacterium currus]AWB23811.1 hypothetical protein DA075_25380 [Methylobacterium currus]
MSDLHSLFGGLSLALFSQMAEHGSSGRCLPYPFTAAVGSARRGEGRTFVAEGLALHAASLSPHRMMLVDGNSARSHLTGRYGGQGEPGLFDFLRGSDAVPRLLTSPLPNLSIVGSGNLPDPTLLYRQDGLKRFLTWAGERANAIIIDMPSFETDALPIVAAVDRVLLVVDATTTSRQAAKAALARIPKSKSWGVVLNRCPSHGLAAVT